MSQLALLPGPVAVVLVAVAFVGALLAVRHLGEVAGLGPEVSRKLLHVGMGLMALTFPYVFTDTVWLLTTSGVVLALVLSVRKVPALRTCLGAGLYRVERSSLGEVYFAISVTALFWLAADRPVFYAIPLLVMTLADALAALIGTEYGRRTFQTRDGAKSLEGSTAFFMAAFFAAHVPLLLGTGTGRAEALLISALIGALGLMLEAAAWRGLDNLFVPIGLYLILDGLAPLAWPELGGLIGALGLLVAITWAGAPRVGIRVDAGMVAVLGGFVLYTAGGLAWLAPGVVMFLTIPLIVRLSPAEGDMSWRPDAVTALAVAAPALVWLALSNADQEALGVYAATVAFAAQLAMISAYRAARVPLGGGIVGRRLYQLGAAAWAVQFAAYLSVGDLSLRAALAALVALPVVWLAAIAYVLRERAFGDTHRLAAQTAIALAASGLAVALIWGLDRAADGLSWGEGA